MAELDCNNLVDDDWEHPVMPHLEHRGDELDRLYPSLVAPEDLDSGAQEEQDERDTVFQTGKHIASAIVQIAADSGRRRHQRGDEGR